MQTGRIGRIPSSDRQHKQQLIQELANRRQHKYKSESETSSETSEGDSRSSAAAADSACEASIDDLSEQSSCGLPRKIHLPEISKLVLTHSPVVDASEEHTAPFLTADEPVQLNSPDGSAAAEGSQRAGLLLHAPAVVLEWELAKRLYPHQVTGLKWLGGLYGKQRGGILGDDMGLGKVYPEVLIQSVIPTHSHDRCLDGAFMLCRQCNVRLFWQRS